MAESSRYVCSHCLKAIEVWSDGNPYYLDEFGAKHYAYHPQEEFERCTGNDESFLCLGCGAEFMADSGIRAATCPECSERRTVPLGEALEEAPCPYCRQGTFRRDLGFIAIS